ncbi:MAG: Smr/MutS family protein [Rhodobacteraceae bacterium]|nr:Smr/MutS family protein [Paracoccaceae bacterium]
MARKRKRGLSEEDRALWEKVRRSVTPLTPTRARTVPNAAPAPPQRNPDPSELPVRQPPKMGVGKPTSAKSGTDLPPSLSDRLDATPLRMDRKQWLRMKRGKTQPEARIDLHGMTLAQAHPALTRFVVDAHDRGLRTVLVITGKGRTGLDMGPMPERRGVLKQQVPHWLSSGPLRQIVQQVTEAHLRHGGAGAYYVRLRRRG